MNDYSAEYLHFKKVLYEYYKHTLNNDWEKAITQAENICNCAEVLLLQTLPHADKDYMKKTDGVYPQMGDRLYSAPSNKPWVSLTDEEMENLVGFMRGNTMIDFARAIEAALRSKNT